jgi:hypothetical protein
VYALSEVSKSSPLKLIPLRAFPADNLSSAPFVLTKVPPKSWYCFAASDFLVISIPDDTFMKA